MHDHELRIPLNADVQQAWDAWLQVTRERCHLHFELEGGNLESHMSVAMSSAMATARRIADDIQRRPKKILEVGSSVGFNCIALSRLFPESEIHGIEPDAEAIAVACSMAAAGKVRNVHFRQGVCEKLPYGEREFDLIVCLTVIEHVRDVDRCIAEMARVLSSEGTIRLEAPNYAWPYEPHLGIWCIPKFGKQFAKLMAVLQGRKKELAYLDHLQFVTPGKLESQFSINALVWENLVKSKLEMVLRGDASQVVAYRRMGMLAKILARVGLGRLVIRIIMRLKLYPSVLYRLRKAARD